MLWDAERTLAEVPVGLEECYRGKEEEEIGNNFKLCKIRDRSSLDAHSPLKSFFSRMRELAPAFRGGIAQPTGCHICRRTWVGLT